MKQPGQLTLEEKATRACLYAARHDIKEYEIKGNRMIYYSNYPELEETHKVIVRLNTTTETYILESKRQRKYV